MRTSRLGIVVRLATSPGVPVGVSSEMSSPTTTQQILDACARGDRHRAGRRLDRSPRHRPVRRPDLDSPRAPQTIRLWVPVTGLRSGAPGAVGILLDGPEPLLKSDAGGGAPNVAVAIRGTDGRRDRLRRRHSAVGREGHHRNPRRENLLDVRWRWPPAFVRIRVTSGDDGGWKRPKTSS